MTAPSFKPSRGARPRRGTRSGAPGRSWRSPQGSGPQPSPPGWSATSAPFAAPAASTKTRGYRDSSRSRSDRADRPGFPPLQRARIVELACLEPVAKGLHITHWSSQDLARQAIADGIVESISPRTIRLILDRVDLQPHRTRYWRTTRLDPRFKARAEKVLWCYGNAERMARRGYWVVCTDEVPNFQVLERKPIRRSTPGSIEQREFDYTRHGTVNLLVFLVVHTGRMRVVVLKQNNAENYIPALEEFRRRHRRLRGVYLIHDGGPSHISGATAEYFDGCHGWWRPRLTPARASWLDQAELLIHAFGARYLRRSSWPDRESFIRHVMASWPEYNDLYAHPFEWTWTNQKMRSWFVRHRS
jgi:DDE superfamily endonuclease